MYYSNHNLQDEAQVEMTKRVSRGFWSRLLGFADNSLCSFECAYSNLNQKHRTDDGIQTINIDQIIGTVSRESGFDSRFHPTKSVSQQRWIRIYMGYLRGDAIPAIEVYQLGDEYFVIDGHHRVSVARAIGKKMIEAHVITVGV
ncbi:MAG: hypothetical protein AAFQ07_14080 [Chloroflexota bacterium]